MILHFGSQFGNGRLGMDGRGKSDAELQILRAISLKLGIKLAGLHCSLCAVANVATKREGDHVLFCKVRCIEDVNCPRAHARRFGGSNLQVCL